MDVQSSGAVRASSPSGTPKQLAASLHEMLDNRLEYLDCSKFDMRKIGSTLWLHGILGRRSKARFPRSHGDIWHGEGCPEAVFNRRN